MICGRTGGQSESSTEHKNHPSCGILLPLGPPRCYCSDCRCSWRRLQVFFHAADVFDERQSLNRLYVPRFGPCGPTFACVAFTGRKSRLCSNPLLSGRAAYPYDALGHGESRNPKFFLGTLFAWFSRLPIIIRGTTPARMVILSPINPDG